MNNITIANKPTTIEITKYFWDASDYKPKVEITLSRDEDKFYITFKTYEKNPLAKKDTHFTQVCEDSCVEWFVNFTPDANDKYFNFEINANGIAYAAYRTNRYDPQLIELQDIENLNITTNIYDEYWTVSYSVPSKLIQKYSPTFDMKNCSYIKTNLYKCGEHTDKPHYGAYFPINTPTPDFHRPECFGIMNVE